MLFSITVPEEETFFASYQQRVITVPEEEKFFASYQQRVITVFGFQSRDARSRLFPMACTGNCV